jgi:hypothetical protein
MTIRQAQSSLEPSSKAKDKDNVQVVCEIDFTSGTTLVTLIAANDGNFPVNARPLCLSVQMSFI